MQLPEMSRRVFLRRSVQAAGALALVPGLAVGCAPEQAARAPADLQVLDPAQWALMGSVADTFVPEGGAFAAGAASIGLAQRIDEFLRGESPELLSGVASALWLVEWASPLAAGRLARFSTLPLEGRTACIDALRRSRIGLLRDVYAGLKQLCLFTFYASDASWPAIGYEGPWLERA